MSLTDQEFMRYNRHIMVEKIGEKGQVALKNSKVAIIGVGGLGCPAALYLAASGVGELSLIDHDKIELSNLQRQILFNQDDIGKAKVKVAKTKLTALNPLCEITAYDASIFDLDLSAIIASHDLVLDCTDSSKTRLFINRVCQQEGVKLVSASAIQGAGQLVSFDFSLHPSPCYQCVFPDDQGRTLNCSSAGVLSPLLGVMGSLQATEALRLLLGYQDNVNKLMLFDAWGMSTRSFNVTSAPHCHCCRGEH